MAKKSENSGKNTGIKNLKPWKKGDPSPNPNGRPVGRRNFATVYREALIKLAEKNEKTPDELEDEILSKGILNARTGDYRFYKDLLDRLHGMPTQRISGEDGEPIKLDVSITDAIKKAYKKRGT